MTDLGSEVADMTEEERRGPSPCRSGWGGLVIICDADDAAMWDSRIHIGYCQMVDGYRHAWREPDGKIRYSRSPNHPPDPACPECHPVPQEDS